MPVYKSTIQNPIITVCIPCYNQENSIKETVDSVLSQGIENIQIIISDDASKDKTPEIVKEYKDRYPDIINLILHEKNHGIAGNVESIQPYIRGKYLCWLDGDDLYLEGKLKKQLDFMEDNPDYLVCFHDVWVNQKDSGIRYRYNDPKIGPRAYSGYVAKEMITNRCFVSGMTMMVRRDAVSGIKQRPEITNCADWLYMIELSIHGKMKFIDEVLAVYNRHDNNISRLDINHIYEEKCFDYLQDRYGDKFEKEIKHGRALLLTMYIFKYITIGQWKKSWHMLKALCHLVRGDISLLWFITSKIFKNMAQRILLLLKTKRINR